MIEKVAGLRPVPVTDALAVPPGVAVTETELACIPRCVGLNVTVTVHIAFGISAALQPLAVNCASPVDTAGTPVVLVPTLVTVNMAVVELVVFKSAEPQLAMSGVI